ncbi:hypothetical protein P7K49_040154, partial [Saguinus oedipus]
MPGLEDACRARDGTQPRPSRALVDVSPQGSQRRNCRCASCLRQINQQDLQRARAERGLASPQRRSERRDLD